MPRHMHRCWHGHLHRRYVAHRRTCATAQSQVFCSPAQPELVRLCRQLDHTLKHVVLVRYRSSGLPTYSSNGLSGPLQGVPGVCSSNTGVNADIVTLEANSSTVHWGYYYAGAAPQLVINSGDTVNVEMVRVQCKRTFLCLQSSLSNVSCTIGHVCQHIFCL